MIKTPEFIPDLWFHADEVVGLHILRMGRITPDARNYGNQMQYAPEAIRWASQLVWLTDDPDPCLPSAYRFKVKPGQELYPWASVRAVWPDSVVAALESRPGPSPDTWWVSGGVVRVELAALVPQGT